MLEQPLFAVSWIIDRFCNYNCSYCWPYAHSDTPNFLPIEVYFRTIDEIKRQAVLNGFDRFHWSFSGGEPTAYKHLHDLIGHLSHAPSSYQSVHMTTNLSPSVKWWDRWCETTATLQRRSLTASFHAEFADEQEFGDKILHLLDRGVYVTVNQVMVPELFTSLYDRCQRLHDRGINVTLKPQSDPTASSVVHGYTPEMIQIMQQQFPQQADGEPLHQILLIDSSGQHYDFDQAERFNAFGFNKFNGWVCNSGYQSVIIRGNDVKRSYSCRDVPLGTLKAGFELFKSPQLCTTQSCVSSADSKIPKQKPNDQ